MLLEMALGSKAPASFQHRCRVTATILLVVCATLTKSAPTTYDEIQAKRTDLMDYFNDQSGCYYNYQHYEEGDRIMTNEPCLNCTCHNRMLMCYLRVCPAFSKAIGQDCTVQKSPDQCCPTISCPEVPVQLLTSTTTQMPTTSTTTEVGWHDNYGCMMNDNEFFPDGAQVPSNPKKPCELCYCIRNRTACVMQECTLHVEGCRPVYQEAVCCPVRYDCDYESEKPTTSAPQISGGLVFSTTAAPFDCLVNNEIYKDGESIKMVKEKPCEHCYCMRGDIVCAVQDCGEPLRGKDCTPETPPAGQCCPTSYQCANETISSDDITTLQPPSQSHSDENEAEKYPLNEDIYDKLGESQSNSQDDTNDVESENTPTTQINIIDSPAILTSDQATDKNEEVHNSVPNVSPTNDGANKISDGNKPVHNEYIKPQTETTSNEKQDPSKQSNEENIVPNNNNSEENVSPTEQNKPLEESNSQTENQSQSENILLEQNQENTQTPIVENHQDNSGVENILPTEIPNVENQATEQNKLPIENNLQTDSKPESENTPAEQNQNNLLPTEIPKVQNDAITEPGKLESENASKEQNPVSPQIESVLPTEISKVENEPTEQNKPLQETNPQANDQLESGNKITDDTQNNSQSENESTEIPKIQYKPTEQSELLVETNPQTSDQPESESTSTEANQNNLYSQNFSPTEIPKDQNEANTPIEGNQGNTQTENKSPTETSNVENKPIEENNQNTENTFTEQNLGNSQVQNLSPTEIPKVENEPTEQNKPLVENNQDTENMPTEQNQYNSQVENASPTDIPEIVNEPTEQNKPLVENNQETENVPTEQNQDSSHVENASSTDIPEVQNNPLVENNQETENVPTEQNQDSSHIENASSTNIPEIQNKPLVENNHETENVPTEQNQDSSQVENASPTDIPKIGNEPTEQSKPLVENSQDTENVPTEQNQDSSHVENASPTDIPEIVNKLTEQNKPLVENNQDIENVPTEQNQDSLQMENSSPTDIPEIVNEPNEQNKPLVENNQNTEIVPTEQNQDSSHLENASPTDIPEIVNEPTEQNKPLVENNQNNENVSTEQNQDSSHVENASPTDIPKIVNEPTEQSKPLVESNQDTENVPTEQNQDSLQVENASPTDIPEIVNELNEQNKPLVENNQNTENVPTEQNQDSAHVENSPSTDIPEIQNKPLIENNQDTENVPTEQNQDSSQVENASPTEIPKIVNEHTEQNKPSVENNQDTENVPTEQNQDSFQVENALPTEIPNTVNKPLVENNKVDENRPIKHNQDSSQVDDGLSTEIPKVENEPTEQNKPLEEHNKINENIPSEQNQDSSHLHDASPTEIPKINENVPTEQNLDSSQVENLSPTEIPKVENEPNEQNNPVIENNKVNENIPIEQNQDSSHVDDASSTEIPKLSENLPTQQNQDNLQVDDALPTEIPKVEIIPTEQHKPLVENNSPGDNQPELQNNFTEQYQDNLPVENVSSTDTPKIENESIQQNNPTENQPESQNTPTGQLNSLNPIENTSKLNEPQTENVVPEKTQIKPAAPAISENNASTDQPEDNIFVVSPSSPPLFSDNQVKGQESTSIPISDDSSTEKNVDKVNPQPSADDKIPSAEYTDNISPQSNNKNTENSTGIKPIISEDDSSASNDVTGNPINEHLPANGEQSDNRLGLNNQANSESTLIPTIETSSVNPENINQDVLVDNISSPDNQPVIVNDQDIVSNSDPNEIKTSTEIENFDNNHVNDFTTNSPQQQLGDNSIPMKLETVTLKEPIKTEDQSKSPNIFSENDTTEKSPESNAPIEISGNQNSDEIFKPTESDVITKLTESTINGIDNIEHSGITQSPNQNNNYENITPHEQSQNKHDNNIIENTSIDPDTSADDKNNLNIATELNQHNEENVTPLSDKIETNSNKVTPIEDESTVIPQLNQVNQGNLENTSNIESLSTTNGYSSEPSVVSSTNIPESQDNGEDENLIVNPTTIKTNINNDQLPNVVPQNNESTNVESTEYNVDDNSTNSPSEVSTNLNNVEANTNASPSKINNGINQDQTTEFEVYGTQSPTEKNILTDVSNKTPTNDAPSSTSQINTNNEIINEYSSENPQNILNKITTSNIYKDNEATTEYVQPGVPGEGSCLINFVTYAHKAEVPKSNPCHEKCECLNSIITCTSVNCPPAPPQHRNCIPLHPGNESWCCPTYMCDGGIEGVLFENNQQLGSPQLISTVLLEDKPGEQNDNKTTIDEVSSTSIPQILLEYTSLATPESETSSDVNLQNSDVLTQTETPNKQTDELIEINKPINADKSSEDEKPSDNSEIDGTTISYTPDLPIVTNQPDTSSNDIKEQNPFPNVVNESQDYPIASSTEEPNYESTVANIHPPSDPSQPEQNSEFDASIVPTTDRPIQQINDNKSGDGINNPIIDKGSEKDTTSDVTDLPENIVNPLDVTQTPNIANDKPSLVENNSNNLRPASIDDIISSVNMVKDAVKNSLETSSKPTESNYQGTESAPIENQPTVLPENLANPSSENSLPEKYNEPFTTVSSINIIPELQTNDEKSPENSVGTELPESVGATQIPNHLEPGNSDSGTVLTDSPISNLPNTQETTGPIMEANADDKTPAELTTAQYSSGTNEQDPTSNGSPILHTVDSTVVPQVNIEPNTNIPEADNKISQISTQQDVLPSSSSESQPTQEQEKPNDAESPISPTVEVIVPPMEEAVDSTGSQSSSTNNPIVGGSTLTNDVKITGEQTSSTLATPVINEEHLENENINPAHETGDMMHIPFNTEKPHSKPTPSSTPFPPPVYTAKPPSYTPIPQSTWTPKPFHQDSITSEAPQPDQGFPDEYEDESEAVFGPGTCRYGGKVYVSAQQVPRDDPCDFCFCFRGDIICLQQSCPPPIFGCYQENIQGFCCPRYECPVAQATTVNVTTTTTTSTTVVPPHFFANAYRGAARRAGCLIHGHAYRVGEDVGIASGPCLECICGADGKMKCDPKPCSPEPLLRKMMAEAVDQKKR